MPSPSTAETAPYRTVRVWDPLLRIFHWSLAICVAAAWGLGQFGPDVMTLHFYFGYAVLGLLAFRLLWGFIGPEHARFASFTYRPAEILRYAGQMLRRSPSYWRGHNPVGGLFAILILLILAVHAASGLFVDPEDYINAGPFADLVGTDAARTALAWHSTLSWVVLGVVVLHVAAIAFYLRWKREDLIRPMITGRKTIPQDA